LASSRPGLLIGINGKNLFAFLMCFLNMLLLFCGLWQMFCLHFVVCVFYFLVFLLFCGVFFVFAQISLQTWADMQTLWGL